MRNFYKLEASFIFLKNKTSFDVFVFVFEGPKKLANSY